jgi:hypothetical protein
MARPRLPFTPYHLHLLLDHAAYTRAKRHAQECGQTVGAFVRDAVTLRLKMLERRGGAARPQD